LPELDQLAEELGPRGFELVTVVTSGGAARANAVVQRVGLSAPVIVADQELLGIYHVDHVPWTVLVDRTGKAREVVRGGQDAEFFRRLVARHL
jgi:hypothetical protein